MKQQQSFTDARLTFPNFPEEIFQLWLDDRIRHNGWPPNGLEWEGFFFGRDIPTWQQVAWHKVSISLDQDQLTPAAYDTILLIIEGAQGKENIMSRYMPDSKNRFMSALSYVQRNGVPPGTVLLLSEADGYNIVDGNHRVAALLANRSQSIQPEPVVIDAWVAG